MAQLSPLPVTLLTGFLGSGKTTLINALLTHNQGEKILIIENEFGATNIDSGLLKQHADIKIIEMTNGCICCSVQGELIDALHQLQRQRLAGTKKFHRIIIETTGLADPAPIIQTFFIDELIRETIRLDAVITLVDSQHILQQLNEHRVASLQLGFADRIILTKTDRIDEYLQQQVVARITRINNKATLLAAIDGQLAKHLWLDIHAFDLTDELNINSGGWVINTNPPLATDFKPVNIAHGKPSWNDNICSYLLEARELDLAKIGAFTEHLIEQYGNDMLRYKGVLAIQGQPQRLILQGVHKVVGFDYGSLWDKASDRQSKLVIIGRNLPFEQLQQAFTATTAR